MPRKKTAPARPKATQADPSQRLNLTGLPDNSNPSKRGPKFRLTAEVVEDIIIAVANGSTIVREIEDHGFNALTFYKWMAKYPEIGKSLEEAVNLRDRLLSERILNLAHGVTDGQIRKRRLEADMIERSLALSRGGINSWAGRRANDHQAQDTTFVREVVRINFGRADKPPDWKITDEFPELGPPQLEGEATQEVSTEDRRAIEKQKIEYFGGS